MRRLYENRGEKGMGAGRTGVIIKKKIDALNFKTRKKTEKIDEQRALLTWVKNGQRACARLSESMRSVTSEMG